MKHVLVTGGAGFAGSNLALMLRENFSNISVTAIDNLHRRGSELNLERLAAGGVTFVRGDVRERRDLFSVRDVDVILVCSGDASVLSGLAGDPDYVLQTNLGGTLNCLELARQRGAGIIFLSTSRVYPVAQINALRFVEGATRFELAATQDIAGASVNGIAENFPLTGVRSLYGATKLASELIIDEYRAAFGVKTLINRCGVLAGPWQMGDLTQGIVGYWVASHIFGRPLQYFGFGGRGWQVRDILHIRDLFRLVVHEIENLPTLSGGVFNAGGGRRMSVSLAELTELSRASTGKTVPVTASAEERAMDIRIYLSDTTCVRDKTGWEPEMLPEQIVLETAKWVTDHRDALKGVLGPG